MFRLSDTLIGRVLEPEARENRVEKGAVSRHHRVLVCLCGCLRFELHWRKSHLVYKTLRVKQVRLGIVLRAGGPVLHQVLVDVAPTRCIKLRLTSARGIV